MLCPHCNKIIPKNKLVDNLRGEIKRLEKTIIDLVNKRLTQLEQLRLVKKYENL